MPNSGCTCWCNCFMLFVSETEIDCQSSKVLQAFAGVNSIQKFLKLGLPIAKFTLESKGTMGTTKEDLDSIDVNSKESLLFEIDLKNVKKHFQSKFGLSRLDCYPVLWCQQEQKRIKWKHKFLQKIACTHMVLKIIDRHPPTNSSYKNIDMFPLHFEGHTLKLPTMRTLEQDKKLQIMDGDETILS